MLLKAPTVIMDVGAETVACSHQTSSKQNLEFDKCRQRTRAKQVAHPHLSFKEKQSPAATHSHQQPSAALRMRDEVARLFQSHSDPSSAQEELQAMAEQHPYLQQVIVAYLDGLESEVGPVNLVGVVFSL